MDDADYLAIAAAFVVVAALYTTVGHAGASGYLAVMGLANVPPEVMRPTALVLNITVAAFTTWRFRSARLVDWRALLPFVAGSIPCAFLGGTIKLPAAWYQGVVGAVLLLSAAILIWRAYSPRFAGAEKPLGIPVPFAVAIGMAIGFLSGLTGTGGGIFLSPVLLLLAWAGPRAAAGLAAPFIMVNSAAGLMGSSLTSLSLPDGIAILVGAALAGALLGTWLGISRLRPRALIVTLAVVMSIAGLKLLARAL